MQMRVLDIIHETAADGPGLRTAVYAAGCGHSCPGCHNPQSWDFGGGCRMDVGEVLDEILSDECCDVSFSGGDPLYQVEAFTELAREVKERSGKGIWCWTGFTLEQVLSSRRLSMILPYIDALVEGPFVRERRDLSLRFRGSSNQRIVLLKDGRPSGIFN